MSATTPQHDMDVPCEPKAGRKGLPKPAKVCAGIIMVPVALFLLIYAILLLTPMQLGFARDPVRAAVMAGLPPTSQLELGDMAMALENGAWPVLRFSPVVLTDTLTGSRIEIDALEVGFSPLRALIGQPGASITIVGPHMQMVQDVFGQRSASFQVIENADGVPTVRVNAGDSDFPQAVITQTGIRLEGEMPGGGKPAALRSSNDLLIEELEKGEKALADVVRQASEGRFSRLVVKDGVVDINDATFGLLKRFDNINFDVKPTGDGRMTRGNFSATLGGQTMVGTVARTVDEEGSARLSADVTNIDFAAMLPFLDDPTSDISVRGTGALSLDVMFAPNSNTLIDGGFKIDLTGIDLRIGTDYFPVASSIIDVNWSPAEASFTMAEAELRVGKSAAKVSGVFRMGLDAAYGPTVAMALHGRDVIIVPEDMDAPAQPFDTVDFKGWSAPLYGATGIDQLVAKKGDGRVLITGRTDMVQAGIGFDIKVAGERISADDLKRLWPYGMAKDGRDWFVANITEGMMVRSTMRFNFPVGTLSTATEEKPLPENAMTIDMVGSGVTVKPAADMAPIAVEGETRLQLRNASLMVSADGGQIATANGPITVSRAALMLDNKTPAESIVEISGDITGGIKSLVALVKERQPQLLVGKKVPVDLNALSGRVDVGVLATIKLPDAETGSPMKFDYVLNGAVADFASSEPIENHTVGNGQLVFSASQEGYQLSGKMAVNGIEANIEANGVGQTRPAIKISALLDSKELAELGFDVSRFLDGEVRFSALPNEDGSISVEADLKDAKLTISDIGIIKARGNDGVLNAVVRIADGVTDLSDIELAFGDVHLAGDLKFSDDAGLRTADFSRFELSAGDSSQLAVAAVEGGYAVRLRGDQLDIKPMLGRAFGLGEGSGGVAANQFRQTLSLDVELKRAIGFYRTTAFNVDLDMAINGSDLRRAILSAQFDDGNSVAITTNPTPDGRTMTVAFNDAGTVLRLLGVYPRLAGGEGSMVLNSNREQKVEAGSLQIRNFSLIDEGNVAQVLGNHKNSQAIIAKQNRLDFKSGRVNFIRRSDRIEVTEGILSGNQVGGTMRGFIYTDQRHYDLAGTYVPLFGLNSAFQKIPLIGPLLGGREGEGLIGVTFAVRGPLDKPDFSINPASALLPGAFRSLFEFRAKEQPLPE